MEAKGKCEGFYIHGQIVACILTGIELNAPIMIAPWTGAAMPELLNKELAVTMQRRPTLL